MRRLIGRERRSAKSAGVQGSYAYLGAIAAQGSLQCIAIATYVLCSVV